MHFSFLPFWLMKSRLWLGATVCLKKKTASLVIQYLLQIQYTAAAAPALQRSSTATFSSFVFILLFRYQMYSFAVLRSVMARCKEKLDYIFCFKKKEREREEMFKAAKIHHREKTLWREVALWYWAAQMNRIPTLGASSQSLLKLIAVINPWDKMLLNNHKLRNAQKNYTLGFYLKE